MGFERNEGISNEFIEELDERGKAFIIEPYGDRNFPVYNG
jgi:hypothetical protein